MLLGPRTHARSLRFLLLAAVLALPASGCSSEHDNAQPSPAAKPSQPSAVVVLRPQATPTQATPAIGESLSRLLLALPKGSEPQYGFASREELSQVSLGTPLPVYSIAPFFAKESGWIPTPIFTNVWRVPVIAQGSSRCLATVVSAEAGWQTVEVGASGLARDIALVQSRAREQLSDGTVVWLRVFQLYADFLLVLPHNDRFDQARIFPLRSASLSLGVREAEPLTATELTPILAKGFAAQREKDTTP